jgi:DNA-nicking Smr family endonuclease
LCWPGHERPASLERRAEGLILYGLGGLTEMNSGKNKDAELFRQAMTGVTPLGHDDRIEPTPMNTPASALQREIDEKAVLKESMRPVADPAELETGEEILFLRPGYQKRILRRLRRGQYSTADTIDLHHMNAETAGQVLQDFIKQSIERGYACVRIIHGKGLRSRDVPRLKILTNRLLRRHSKVIAFASCRPMDGGTGAVDVLLSAHKKVRT